MERTGPQNDNWNIVWLVLEIVGDRTSKFDNSKVDYHVKYLQGRATNTALLRAHKLRDWLSNHAIGRAIRDTISWRVVLSITTSDDWLHDLMPHNINSVGNPW